MYARKPITAPARKPLPEKMWDVREDRPEKIPPRMPPNTFTMMPSTMMVTQPPIIRPGRANRAPNGKRNPSDRRRIRVGRKPKLKLKPRPSEPLWPSRGLRPFIYIAVYLPRSFR